MTVLDPPRHPFVDRALRLAQHWCDGHVIDDAPALTHAVAVARTLVDHIPDVDPVLVAAAIVHDAEDFTDDPGPNLDIVLDHGIAGGVARIVRALAAQHRAIDSGEQVGFDDLEVAMVAAADKVIAFKSLHRRAQRSGEPGEFWRRREALRRLLPTFRRWSDDAHDHLPASLAAALAEAITGVECDVAFHAGDRRDE